MYKRCQVVMLPTNEKATNGICVLETRNGLEFPATGAYVRRIQNSNTSITVNHLYILSDETIQIGDYCILHNSNTLSMKTTDCDNTKDFKKVIATTDTACGLPAPSKAFIAKYCELDGNINEVMVEHILVHDLRTEDKSKEFEHIPKVSSDNTITIKKVEEKTYTKDQVVGLVRQAHIFGKNYALFNNAEEYSCATFVREYLN